MQHYHSTSRWFSKYFKGTFFQESKFLCTKKSSFGNRNKYKLMISNMEPCTKFPSQILVGLGIGQRKELRMFLSVPHRSWILSNKFKISDKLRTMNLNWIEIQEIMVLQEIGQLVPCIPLQIDQEVKLRYCVPVNTWFRLWPRVKELGTQRKSKIICFLAENAEMLLNLSMKNKEDFPTSMMSLKRGWWLHKVSSYLKMSIGFEKDVNFSKMIGSWDHFIVLNLMKLKFGRNETSPHCFLTFFNFTFG